MGAGNEEGARVTPEGDGNSVGRALATLNRAAAPADAGEWAGGDAPVEGSADVGTGGRM